MVPVSRVFVMVQTADSPRSRLICAPVWSPVPVQTHTPVDE